MYQMRRLPPFSGDDFGSLATVLKSSATALAITIPRPLEHADSHPLVQMHDEVRLNHSSVRYRVIDVNGKEIPGKLVLSLSLGLNAGFGAIRPSLSLGTTVPYVIYRQPRKLESSRVDLPDGYLIDLRFSGPFGVFNQVNTVADDSVRLFFDSNGAIDRYTYVDSSDRLISNVVQDAFYFYVAAYELESTAEPILSPSNMWVSIDRSTGSINVAYNAPPPTTLTPAEAIQYARGFGKLRSTADQ